MKTTGWPPGLLQDDDSKLSKWFASRPDARYLARKNAMTDKQPEALRLAEALDKTLDFQARAWEAAAELRRLHDLLGKANALCRIRAERIKELEQKLAQRQPLTDEQIDLLINGRGDEGDDDYVEPTVDGSVLTDADLVRLVRRVEAHHGITGEQK